MHQLCTYFDQRYLLKGRALSQSLNAHAGDFRLWVLCLDNVTLRILEAFRDPRLRLVSLPELEAWEPKLSAARNDRTLVEYYWTCTPTWLAYVLAQQTAGEWVSYLDADLYFFSGPGAIFDEACGASVIIHPHRFSPQYQPKALTSGIYNVGLTAFRQDELGWKVLRWWQAACLVACFLRPQDGYCGDQKYLDDWPDRFAGVHVLKHVGAGLAPWNVDNYQIRLAPSGPVVDSLPLIFYHFHAFQMFASRIAWQRGYNLPALVRQGVYFPYVRALQQALTEVRRLRPFFLSGFKWPYRQELLNDLHYGRFMWV